MSLSLVITVCYRELDVQDTFRNMHRIVAQYEYIYIYIYIKDNMYMKIFSLLTFSVCTLGCEAC